MRCLFGWTPVIAFVVALWPAGVSAQETPAAKATRKKLAQKISVDFTETRMKDAMNEIKSEFDNRLGIWLDNVGGVSNNSKVTFKADDQPLEKILNDFCKKYELGWFVFSKQGDRYDGWIKIRKSNERGYEKGKEPTGKQDKETRRQVDKETENPTARLVSVSPGLSVFLSGLTWLPYSTLSWQMNTAW
jgi:hypothetical protein